MILKNSSRIQGFEFRAHGMIPVAELEERRRRWNGAVPEFHGQDNYSWTGRSGTRYSIKGGANRSHVSVGPDKTHWRRQTFTEYQWVDRWESRSCGGG